MNKFVAEGRHTLLSDYPAKSKHLAAHILASPTTNLDSMGILIPAVCPAGKGVRLIGQGARAAPPQELLKANGAYAKLVNAQDLGDTKGSKKLDVESSNEDMHGEIVEKKSTTVQTSGSTPDFTFSITKRSLIRCLIIFFSENGSLWPEYLALVTIASPWLQVNYYLPISLLLSNTQFRRNVSCSGNLPHQTNQRVTTTCQ